MSKILFTGGRAPVTLHLARLFHAAGHTVFVADCLSTQLCSTSNAVRRCFEVPAPNSDPVGFLAGLSGIVRSESIDVLVPTCEEVFHLARGRALIPCPVFAPDWSRLQRLHSKWDFNQDLIALGKPVPRTWLLQSVDDLSALLESRPAAERLVLKPVFSRFAVNVHVVMANDPLPSIRPSEKTPWVAQAFVVGQEVCAYAVAREGRLHAYAAYQPDFTAAAAGVHFRPLVNPKLEAWVSDVVAGWSLTGQVAFDLIETPDGNLMPLECNPRATSGALLFNAADRLDQAFLVPLAPCLRPRQDARAMIGLAMWLYALPDALMTGPDRFGEWARAIADTPDAIFRWEDPLPTLHQFAVYAEFLRRAKVEGGSTLGATTTDIEWNGNP